MRINKCAHFQKNLALKSSEEVFSKKKEIKYLAMIA